MAKDFLWGEEFKLDVARGKARGAEVRNIFGQNDAQTTTFRAVWELSNTTDYVFPSTAQIVRVASDSACLLYTSPSPRDATLSRMPSSA